MIKKTVVCDICKKGEPLVIIPKSHRLKSNTVLCEECAVRYYEVLYYDLSCDIRCDNCGEPILASYGYRGRFGTFCSIVCVIHYCEGHSGNDEQRARYFTESDEKMLLGEDEQED